MPIAKGAQVRQVVPAIQGEVTARRFNEEADCMEYLVAYTDADGEPAERWFLETQLEPQE
jgi:hypothetical protein